MTSPDNQVKTFNLFETASQMRQLGESWESAKQRARQYIK